MLIAIGDLHGHVRALDRIIAALDERYGILAPDGVLRGGVTLVTTGDYIDRGSHGLEVIAFFAPEGQADTLVYLLAFVVAGGFALVPLAALFGIVE